MPKMTTQIIEELQRMVNMYGDRPFEIRDGMNYVHFGNIEAYAYDPKEDDEDNEYPTRKEATLGLVFY